VTLSGTVAALQADIDLVRGTVFFVHLVVTILWIGGLFVLALAVMPAAREALGHRAGVVMRPVMRRFGPLALIGLLGAAPTGVYLGLADPSHPGELFGLATTWSVLLVTKSVLFLVLAALTVALAAVGMKMAKVAPGEDEGPTEAYERLGRWQSGLAWAGVAVGLLVLLATGLLATL
jgi:copper transport protein